MAAAVSQGGQRSPGANDGFDDFTRFQSGKAPPQHQQSVDDYYSDDDDDANFEPQNGYVDDEEMDYDDQPDIPIPKKERKPREPLRMPKVDLKAKFAAMNEKVKKARMPSPHELREGYLNSSFHKSFQQPLTVRSRVMVDPKELEQRQELIKTATPSELGNINSLSDLPVPTSIKNLLSPSERKIKEIKRRHSLDQEDAVKAWGMYGTLPRSMRETKLVTNCREMCDEGELKQRQELIQTKSPTELSQIHGLSDLPLPSKIQKIFKKPRSRSGSLTQEKRTRSESLPRTIGGTIYETLPRSWRQQNLITQVKVEEDPEVLEKRRALTEAKTPAELSQITSLSDLPIPTALEKFLKKAKQETEAVEGNLSQVNLSNRLRNLESMYDSLPKSLKTEVLVRTKVEADEEVLKKRQELVESKKPAELSQIQSLSDIPLPTPIENLFKSKANGEASEDQVPKKKLNLNELFSYDALPESLKAEVLVRTKVEEDPEVLRDRQEVVKTKSPYELSQINCLDDFPLPQRIDTLVRAKKRNLKSTAEKEGLSKNANSKSWTSLTSYSNLYDAIPSSLKSEVLVRSRVETPEVQKERAETVKNKTVAELSQINSIAEIPLPRTIENIIHSDVKIVSLFDRPSSEAGSEPRSFRENLYDTLPRSMKSEVLVRVRDEDPEVQRTRQELIRSKSPTELSQINSLAEFPIPTTLENLMKKISPEPPKDGDNPPQPPRRFKKEMIYESLPDSFKTEVLVRTKIETDEEVLKLRQELCRSKSPIQLSEIHDLSEFPLPTFVENIKNKTLNREKPAAVQDPEKEQSVQEKKTFYEHLPETLKTECLVRSKIENPEKQRARAELIKAKSVNELSQITSMAEFPIPTAIETLIQRVPRPVERKRRFREKQRSLSAKNLREQLYETLPRSLKSEVLVRGRIEDPEVREERKKLVQSKSVSELSQINSFAEFPIPKTIEKIIAKVKTDPTIPADEISKCQSPGIPTPTQMKENIYASLPRSLKSEVLVRTRVESPDLLRERQQITQSKSVSELSQMRTLSDLPIPTTIENVIKQAKALKQPKPESEGIDPPASPGPETGNYDIYASLPRSLKSQVIVRSKIEEDDESVRKRQALTELKTPVELSQIHSFSEIPLPKRIEEWLHHNEQLKDPEDESSLPRQSRSFHELRTSVYETLPKALREPTLVRTKIENPEVQRERFELTRSKTPSQLAEMHTLADVPIPGLWERGREPGKKGLKVERSLSIPKNTQEFKEIVLNKIVPESLVKPCVVRCKVEDPEILIRRQQVQQSKSIHELSKIRNLNEFPLPINIKLPDLPFPSAKKFLKNMASRPTMNRKLPDQTNGADSEFTPASTPRTQDRTYTDDEMLRFDTGSPDSTAHREQDFGYEVIELESGIRKGPNKSTTEPWPLNREDQDEESLAEQYRGTPPLRSKKKKGSHRNSHEVSEQSSSTEQAPAPPPLPPKKPSGSNRKEERISPGQEDEDGGRIQTRPLPAPPAPARSLKRGSHKRTPSPHAAGLLARSSSSHSQVDQFLSVASTMDRTLVDSSVDRRRVVQVARHSDDNDDTLADSIVDSMQSCEDTLHGNGDDFDDPTLHSCADTLADSDDEFFSEHVDASGRHWRTVDLPRDDDDTPTVSQGREDLSTRLRNDTQELGRELLQHVENLRTTLDKMSSRLGTSPEPHSH